MLKKVSSTTIWLVIFGVIVAAQAYSAFAYGPDIDRAWEKRPRRFGLVSKPRDRIDQAGRGSLFSPTRKSLEFQTKLDDYGAELLCLNDAGTETCFRKEKQ